MQGWWDGSVNESICTQSMTINSIPRTHMVETKNQFHITEKSINTHIFLWKIDKFLFTFWRETQYLPKAVETVPPL